MNCNHSHNKSTLQKICYGIPKAELHVHIEGTFEPELIFEIATRNKITLPYSSIEELKEKYNFSNLQEFLDIYYSACSILITERDFEDLMYAYLKKSSSQGAVYAEIFFDPQSHFPRVSFDTMIKGLLKGIQRGKEDFNFEAKLIMCFLRHLTEEDAFKTFEMAEPHLENILGIGLDSSEVGFPPEIFKNIYKLAKEKGLRLVAHGGEEGDVQCYIKGAIDHLQVERVDHGVRIIDDLDYMKELAKKQIPLTLCPISNKRLKVCPDLKNYPLRVFLDAGLLVMLNSDDPAYFGGYIGDNYAEIQAALDLSLDEVVKLAKNSFNATFMEDTEKEYYIKRIDEYVNSV